MILELSKPSPGTAFLLVSQSLHLVQATTSLETLAIESWDSVDINSTMDSNQGVIDVGNARYILHFSVSEGEFISSGSSMPITDVVKKQLAQKVRLHYKVCRDCGARNPEASNRCRKCHGHNLRTKKRQLGAK